MRVVPLHELIKGLLSEGKVFRLFTRPEGGVQAGYVEMPSQHMGAEAVYCGYVGPTYALRRPVKPGGLVALLLSRQGGQPVPYALFHLGRSGTREGHYQQVVRACALQYVPRDALRKHGGLAAACRRGNYKAAGGLYGPPLLGRPVSRHFRPPCRCHHSPQLRLCAQKRPCRSGFRGCAFCSPAAFRQSRTRCGWRRSCSGRRRF